MSFVKEAAKTSIINTKEKIDIIYCYYQKICVSS